MKEKEVLSYEEALKILTTAEVRVLDEVEKGYTNKIIAEKLEFLFERFTRTETICARK